MAEPSIAKVPSTPSAATSVKSDASLGDLLGELTQETLTLARQEINLAKVEMTEKVNKVVKDLVFLAAGGAIAYAGLLFILGAIAAWLGGAIDLGMSAAMSMALAILIVGAIVAVIGFVLVKKGLDELKNITPVPQQTVETLKEDKQWAQRQI